MNDVYCTPEGDLDNSVCISEEDYNQMSDAEIEATLATLKKDSTIYFTEAVLKAHERITNEILFRDAVCCEQRAVGKRGT